MESAETRLRTIQRQLVGARRAAAEIEDGRIRQAIEASGRVSAELELTRDPALARLFELRARRDMVGRDVSRLQALLDEHRSTGRPIRVEALDIIPGAARSGELRRLLDEVAERRAQRRTLQIEAPSETRRSDELTASLALLERRAIPAVVEGIIQELQAEQAVLRGAIDESLGELQRIPPEILQKRRVEERVRELERRHAAAVAGVEAARRAATAPTVELRILDYAVVRADPASRLRIPLTVAAFFVCFGGTLAMGLLGDRLKADHAADPVPLLAIALGAVLAAVLSARLF